MHQCTRTTETLCVPVRFLVLMAATPATLPAFRQIPKVKNALEGFGDDDVLAAIDRRKRDDVAPTEPLRTTEFRQLIASKDEVPGELPPEDIPFFARKVEPLEPLSTGFSRLVLAAKREKRCLTRGRANRVCVIACTRVTWRGFAWGAGAC